MARHLVVVHKGLEKEKRSEFKSNRRTNVDFISVRYIDGLLDLVGAEKTKISETEHGFAKWDTISLLFNGQYNEDEGRVSIMGEKVCVDISDSLFEKGDNYAQFKNVMTGLATFVSNADAVVHRGIYLYASNVGPFRGVQQLLRPFVACQVYVATNSTTENGENNEWLVQWGNSHWYALTRDQRKNAKRNLFHNLSSMSLADDIIPA